MRQALFNGPGIGPSGTKVHVRQHSRQALESLWRTKPSKGRGVALFESQLTAQSLINRFPICRRRLSQYASHLSALISTFRSLYQNLSCCHSAPNTSGEMDRKTQAEAAFLEWVSRFPSSMLADACPRVSSVAWHIQLILDVLDQQLSRPERSSVT